VDTAAFLGKLWRGDRDMEMERQEEDRKKQENADPAPPHCVGSRGLARLHEPLDTPASRPCQTFVPQLREMARARSSKLHW